MINLHAKVIGWSSLLMTPQCCAWSQGSIQELAGLCFKDNLKLNTVKMVIDFRRKREAHASFSINRAHIERVWSFRFPGTCISEDWGPHLDCQHINTHQKVAAETPFTVKPRNHVECWCTVLLFGLLSAMLLIEGLHRRWPGLLRRSSAALSPPRKHAGLHYLNRAKKVLVDSYHPGLPLFSFLPLYPEQPPSERHNQAAIATYVNKNATFQS